HAGIGQSSSSSLSSGLTFGRKKAARTGGGIGDPRPLTAFQMTSLKRRSSSWSSLARSAFSDQSAPHAPTRLTAFMSVLGTSFAYAAVSALALNEWYIGRAAASNWLIGLGPEIGPTVLNKLDVHFIGGPT